MMVRSIAISIIAGFIAWLVAVICFLKSIPRTFMPDVIYEYGYVHAAAVASFALFTIAAHGAFGWRYKIRIVAVVFLGYLLGLWFTPAVTMGSETTLKEIFTNPFGGAFWPARGILGATVASMTATIVWRKRIVGAQEAMDPES